MRILAGEFLCKESCATQIPPDMHDLNRAAHVDQGSICPEISREIIGA